MGSALGSRSSSDEEEGWGEVQDKDEDLFVPIKNFGGETIGWRERTESDKLRRKRAKEDFEEVRDSEEEVEDIHISEVDSDYEDVATPSPPPPPPPPPPIEIEEEDPPVDEATEEEGEDEEDIEEEERQPSAKSTTVGHIVPHRERVVDRFKPSVHPKLNFSKEEAAARLYKALKTADTDEDTIIEVLTSHTFAQRNKIEKTYKYNHRRNLANDLRSKLSSHFERLCLALLQDPAEFCVESLRRLVEGHCRINDIVGILAWKEADTLDDIKKIYRAKYRNELDDDLEEHVEKKFKPVVRICVSDSREDEVDDEQVYQDVKELIEAVQAGDKDSFKLQLNHVLCCRPWSVLPDMLDLFEQINHGKDLGHCMRKLMGKHTAEAFQPLFFILDEPSAFYAEELFDATEGLGTNDEKLQRIFVLRAEVDLRSIDHVYKNQFGKHLDKLVREETGGHYRNTLLGLLPHGRTR